MELWKYDEHAQKIFYHGLLLAKKNNHAVLEVEHLMLATKELPNIPLAKKLSSRDFVELEKIANKNPPLKNKSSPEFGQRLSFILDELETGEHSAKISVHVLWDELIKNCFAFLEMTPEKKEVKKNAPPPDKRSKNADEQVFRNFCIDLTAKARRMELDPVIGREKEMGQVIEIFARQRKNNVMLIGEPGVGKSAMVEFLAQKIVAEDVPEFLKGVRVFSLDVGLLIAGAKFRGELEERFKKLISALEKNKDKMVLFIDEVHMLIGAGGQEGGVDLANMIKPALARSSFKCVAATTLDEYRKHIEKDPALERRFHLVEVGEPSAEETVEVLSGIKDRFEKFHNLKIPEKILPRVVELSAKFLPHRNFPDKAVDLLDQACSHSKLKNAAQKELTEASLKEALSNWTGIPVQELTPSENEFLKNLETHLQKNIFGQDQALLEITKALKRFRAGIQDPHRPLGVFLFLGPTGVGKTETAKVLADVVFKNKSSFIRFDMSEFAQEHQVARLMGAPPGYIGHNEGGELTEAIHHNPHSLVLFDEIEKAHPKIFDVFLQMFDDGRLTDSRGKVAHFQNCLIILTSNIPVSGRDEENLRQQLIDRGFRPELINRIDEIVPFNSLGIAEFERIIDQETVKLNKLLEPRNVLVQLDESIKFRMITQSQDSIFGARNLKRKYKSLVMDWVAEYLMDKQGFDMEKLSLSWNEQQQALECKIQKKSLAPARSA